MNTIHDDLREQVKSVNAVLALKLKNPKPKMTIWLNLKEKTNVEI